MHQFKLVSPFKPMGDQIEAIDKLVAGVKAGKKEQVLLGGTGTGKHLQFLMLLLLLINRRLF